MLRSAFRLLNKNGIIHISSCAYHILPEILKESIRMASADTNKCFLVLSETSQSSDHPYLLQHPETLYLKGYNLKLIEP